VLILGEKFQADLADKADSSKTHTIILIGAKRKFVLIGVICGKTFHADKADLKIIGIILICGKRKFELIGTILGE
jgi:hypothetical protein